MPADDESADAEMMLFAIAHNDAMFALMCPQAHIIAAGSIMRDPFPTNRYSRFAGDPKGSAHHLPGRANIIEKSTLSRAFFWCRWRGSVSARPARLGLPRLSTLPRRVDSLPLPFDPLLCVYDKDREENSLSVFMVPVAGVEPARCCHRWILNPVRLPIPSHRRLW